MEKFITKLQKETAEVIAEMDALCLATGIDRNKITSARRYGNYVEARKFIAKKLAKKGYTVCSIGAAMGGRHHTTIMRYLKD